MPSSIDLDSTLDCPLGRSCISCGARETLLVNTAHAVVGVFCLTLCVDCMASESLPRYSPVAAVHAVLEHCGHLGITADQMEEQLRREALERPWPEGTS